MPVPESLVQRVALEVRVLLTRRQLRGADLAAALDVSPASVSAKINGRTPFSLEDLERIAEWLNVPVTDLLGIEQETAS